MGDPRAGRRILRRLAPGAREVAADPAYDARDIYQGVETHGARPIIKPKRGAREGTLDARGRAPT